MCVYIDIHTYIHTVYTYINLQLGARARARVVHAEPQASARVGQGRGDCGRAPDGDGA